MKAVSIILHSQLLTFGNILSIIVAYGFYFLLRELFPSSSQIIFQAPVAALLSIAGFNIWLSVSGRISPQSRLENIVDRTAVFILALIWTPAIFIPLHFLTQGYRTSFDNILSIWLFQLPVNLLALWISQARPAA